MHKILNWGNRHCTCNSIGLIFTIFSVISSLVTVIYFISEYSNHQKYNYIYQYKPAVYTPITGYAQQVNCYGKPMWVSVLKDASGRTIVENPFAVRKTRGEAIADRYTGRLNVNATCLCVPIIDDPNIVTVSNVTIRGCSVWAQCIYDTNFLDYIQRDNTHYNNTYVSFIIASLVSIFLSLIGLPTAIILIIQKYKAADKQYIEMH